MILGLFKRVTFILALCAGINNIALAQTSIWSVNAGEFVGKFVKFEEYASLVDYSPVSKICVIKLADPDVTNSPTITVVIHNVRTKKYINWLQGLEGFTITITGRLLLEKGKFIINGNDPHTHIEPEGGASNIYLRPPPPTTGPPSPDPDVRPPAPDTTHHK